MNGLKIPPDWHPPDDFTEMVERLLRPDQRPAWRLSREAEKRAAREDHRSDVPSGGHDGNLVGGSDEVGRSDDTTDQPATLRDLGISKPLDRAQGRRTDLSTCTHDGTKSPPAFSLAQWRRASFTRPAPPQGRFVPRPKPEAGLESDTKKLHGEPVVSAPSEDEGTRAMLGELRRLLEHHYGDMPAQLKRGIDRALTPLVRELAGLREDVGHIRRHQVSLLRERGVIETAPPPRPSRRRPLE
jgi:hypothetical protein